MRKSVQILTLLGLQIIAASAQFHCPANWGYFADPEDCSSYYVCENAHAFRYTCEIASDTQLLFNDVAILCDWPQNVQCGDRPIPGDPTKPVTTTEATVTTTLAPVTTAEGPVTTTVVPVTTTGGPVTTTEAPVTTTGGPVTTTKTPVTTTEAPEPTTTAAAEQFVCPDKWGNFADPKDCSSYYVCENGVASHFQCQFAADKQLLWDNTFNQCNWPEQVQCGARPIPGQTTVSPVTSTVAPVTTTEAQVTTTKSPVTTTDVPVTTTNVPVTTATAPVTTTQADEFVCPEVSGNFPDPNNCMKYFMCHHGVAYRQHCEVALGQQLLFDAGLSMCQVAENVDCGSRPTCDQHDQNCLFPTTSTSTSTSTSTQAPETTPTTPEGFQCPEPFGYFPDPDNCIQFYACSNEVAIEITCAVTNGIQLLYNVEGVRCDLPSKVDCAGRPICDRDDANCQGDEVVTSTSSTTTAEVMTSTADNGTTAVAAETTTTSAAAETTTAAAAAETTTAAGPFVCPAPEGLFPDPANCIKFYQCSNGDAYRHTCPMGAEGAYMRYDPATTRCNHARFVDCGSRPLCGARDEYCTDPEDGPSTPAPTPSPSCADVTCQWANTLVPRSQCDHCFCQCSNFVPLELCCPENLIYHPPTNRCEYAHEVGCTARDFFLL